MALTQAKEQHVKNPRLAMLHNAATRLRIDSIRATWEAGSGHMTSSCSAADIVATLFFGVMRYDPKNPRQLGNDRFILSKGHASPVLYAVWAEAGLLERAELLKLRKVDSDLEGHPTTRLPFVDMSTGALGQGLSGGIGMAWTAKHLDRADYRTYVLLGDGECAEGAVWEAAQLGRHYRLDNLCAIVDVNRLGQSDPTMLEHDMDRYKHQWEGFGWHAIVVDGHDLQALTDAFTEAGETKGRPTVVLAKTIKGKGVPEVEDKPGWHGKPPKSEDMARQAIERLQGELIPDAPGPMFRPPTSVLSKREEGRPMLPPTYTKGDQVATRTAFGDALVALGTVNQSLVGLDGDVKDSTRMQKFADHFPERFLECYIAEQNMVGAAVGIQSLGRLPFVATFACFLTRAHDFIRMASISNADIKFMGSHVGVSIGEDGPSQMGLEDIAMMAAQPNMVVLYPADAVATHWLVNAAAGHQGMVYIRTNRPETPVIYDNKERFPIGGSKVLRRSDSDRITIVTAGMTLLEALKASDQLQETGIPARVIDLYSIKPIDRRTLIDAARHTHGRILTVEEHYEHGGLGDAVLAAVAEEGARVRKLAVREIPRSGKPAELLNRYGIGANAIISAAEQMLA